jgi:hypothetical protein
VDWLFLIIYLPFCAVLAMVGFVALTSPYLNWITADYQNRLETPRNLKQKISRFLYFCTVVILPTGLMILGLRYIVELSQ